VNVDWLWLLLIAAPFFLASALRVTAYAARLLRAERVPPVHFLLAIAVRLLPLSERDRYLEEFRAELLDVPRNTRLTHALSLVRGVFVLRLRRGLNKATDAAVRRAKG
jgi:hypothetical protein